MDEATQVFARHGDVDALEVDDEFRGHLTSRATYPKHQVNVTEVLQVHAGAPKYFVNTGGHRAPIVMVGPTVAGRFLCVPVEPTGRMGVWRPITAFDANTHHKDRYRGG